MSESSQRARSMSALRGWCAVRFIAAWVFCVVPGLWSGVAFAQSGAAGQGEAAQGEGLSELEQARADAVVFEGDAAGEAFVAGDATEAARRYKVRLDTEGPDPNLLYNLGTVWAHAGDAGRAVWALERARLRAPRDVEINHNLNVMRERVRVARMEQRVRGQLTEGLPDGVYAYRMLTGVRLWEVLIPLGLANLLLFVFVGLRRSTAPGGLRDAWTVGAAISALLLLAALGVLVARQATISQVQIGVVLDVEAGLSETPTASSSPRRHPDLYQGATVRVLTTRDDGWVQVGLVGERVGWVRARHVGLVD